MGIGSRKPRSAAAILPLVCAKLALPARASGQRVLHLRSRPSTIRRTTVDPCNKNDCCPGRWFFYFWGSVFWSASFESFSAFLSLCLCLLSLSLSPITPKKKSPSLSSRDD